MLYNMISGRTSNCLNNSRVSISLSHQVMTDLLQIKNILIRALDKQSLLNSRHLINESAFSFLDFTRPKVNITIIVVFPYFNYPPHTMADFCHTHISGNGMLSIRPSVNTNSSLCFEARELKFGIQTPYISAKKVIKGDLVKRQFDESRFGRFSLHRLHIP